MSNYKLSEKYEFERQLAISLQKYIDGDTFTKEDVLILSCATEKDLMKAFYIANNNRLAQIPNAEERIKKMRNFSTMSLAISNLSTGNSIKIAGEIVTPITKKQYITSTDVEFKKKSL